MFSPFSALTPQLIFVDPTTRLAIFFISPANWRAIAASASLLIHPRPLKLRHLPPFLSPIRQQLADVGSQVQQQDRAEFSELLFRGINAVRVKITR